MVTEHLAPIKLQSSIIRNLLLFVDFLPVAYLFGLVTMTVSSRFQRLGDFAAGSLVIYQPSHSALTQKMKQLESSEVHPIAPNTVFNAEQQTAIIDFALNTRHLSDDRAARTG